MSSFCKKYFKQQTAWIHERQKLSNKPDFFFEEVSKTLDRGVAVEVVYLDFAKAFDSVPHTQLMCKVKYTGLKRSVYKWIENWLKDRIQRVVVNDSHSEWSKVVVMKLGTPDVLELHFP